MNTIDAIALLIMLIFAVRGLYKGLINELFSLIAIVLGIGFVYFFGNDINAVIQQNVSVNNYMVNVLFIVQFVLVIVIIKYIGKSVTSATKLLALGTMNRLLGGLFGLIKSLAVLFLGSFVLITIQKAQPDLLNFEIYESYTINIFNQLYGLI